MKHTFRIPIDALKIEKLQKRSDALKLHYKNDTILKYEVLTFCGFLRCILYFPPFYQLYLFDTDGVVSPCLAAPIILRDLFYLCHFWICKPFQLVTEKVDARLLQFKRENSQRNVKTLFVGHSDVDLYKRKSWLWKRA